MKPETFMNDFERTAWGDAHYSVIGRALTFATRFECLCRSLNILLGVKENKSILDSEEEIIEFVDRLYKLRLVQHISSIAGDENQLKNILDKGRRARNEIAHETTIGLDHCIDTLPNKHIDNLMDGLRGLIIDLAEADRAISLITSVVTNEHLPTPGFLEKYPHLIEKWVMEIVEVE